MTEENAQPDSIAGPVDLRVMCVIVGALALFAPFLVQIETTGGQATFVAMMWAYISPGPGGGFTVFGLMDWIFLFPFAVWRVVFVYQMVRYYRGKSTRNRTILAGILAEIPLLALYYFITYVMRLGMGSYLAFPIPLMLVAASVFLWLTPYPVPRTPFDDTGEPDQWWSHEVDSPVEPPNEPPRKATLAHVESQLKCPRCGSKETGREMHPGSFGIRARFVYSCRKCGNQWE